MRICKYKQCDNNIEHLPAKYKYCTLTHRQQHHSDELCKRSKKKRKCKVCTKPYDYTERCRKQTCSDKCETKMKNIAKTKGWTKHVKDSRVCARCGVPITAKAHPFCSGCYVVNREIMKFKEEMNG